MCQPQWRPIKEQPVSFENNVECSHTEMDCGVDSLQPILEELRTQLTQLVSKKGTFLDEEVVQLSQHLDQYILLIQQLQSV